jgi:outer membrane biosynthesis protein TonB
MAWDYPVEFPRHEGMWCSFQGGGLTRMKKILLFVMLMFAVNVMLFNANGTDLFAAKKQTKEQKATKKATKAEKKATKAEKKAAKEAREEKAAKKAAKEERAAKKAAKEEKAARKAAKETREEKAAKREAKREAKTNVQEGRQTRGADGRTYITGPRGGCYYINANGNKEYVDRNLCK